MTSKQSKSQTYRKTIWPKNGCLGSRPLIMLKRTRKFWTCSYQIVIQFWPPSSQDSALSTKLITSARLSKANTKPEVVSSPPAVVTAPELLRNPPQRTRRNKNKNIKNYWSRYVKSSLSTETASVPQASHLSSPQKSRPNNNPKKFRLEPHKKKKRAAAHIHINN